MSKLSKVTDDDFDRKRKEAACQSVIDIGKNGKRIVIVSMWFSFLALCGMCLYYAVDLFGFKDLNDHTVQKIESWITHILAAIGGFVLRIASISLGKE